MAPKKESFSRKTIEQDYPYGFSSKIDSERLGCGLNEEVIRTLSRKKKEPSWLLAWRLSAYEAWYKMSCPQWANVSFPPIDYQAISYYAAPKKRNLRSLEELDEATRTTFEKLGIPVNEQKRLAGVALDLVVDSASVATTFHKELEKLGIIFCSFNEAVEKHPALVKKYLGRVVSKQDNFYAALNAAVFSDGSFCYVPPGVRCPLELSTYFRINAANTGQFERTLIIADEGSYVSYLEGCSAPMRTEHQLHAAVVEIYAAERAEVRYATVQNWYPGDAEVKGGVYNFVTKRGLCAGKHAKIAWTQVETGSAITWKYPSCILQGDHSCGEFYSVAITKGRQQADTGTKMIHLGQHTKSKIIAKGISAGHGRNTYRGLVKILARAKGARNFSQCDSLLLGADSSAFTFPYIEVKNKTAVVEHEATTSKLSEEQLFYCGQRGIPAEEAAALIVLGACKEVMARLPMEFAAEARKLVALNLEGSVG
ncbi:MAG: Fe-S cluster assembly protein SufB [Bacteroidota bacterium]